MNARKKRTRQRPASNRWIKVLWALFLIGMLAAAGFFYLLSKGFFGELPNTEVLENPSLSLASEVYTADSVLLGKYYQQNRSTAQYDELSPYIIQALLATEDVRFFDHPGIDPIGLVAVPYYLLKGRKRGASTITQQLAKNLFPRERYPTFWHLVLRKFKEWIIAARLEYLYTKEEILTMYLNTVDFGSNAYGIKSAARTFFGKEPSRLGPEEAALLIGMLKAPYLYSPIYHPENAIRRRNVVLHQMTKYNFLTPEAYDSLAALPIVLNYSVQSHLHGIARYYREYLRIRLGKWARDNGYNLYADGLKIYTSIDSRLQKYAEEALWEHMKNLQRKFDAELRRYRRKPWGHDKETVIRGIHRSERYKSLKKQGLSEKEIMEIFRKPVKMTVFTYDGPKDTVMSPLDSVKYYKRFLQAGFIVMEPGTGRIKAWVGGIDYRFFKYDHVRPSSRRQVGSTFKPFVYAQAIINGYSPCTRVPNMPVVFPEYDNWAPKNADTNAQGRKVTLYYALGHSINWVTARLIKEIGPQPVIRLARKMGITAPIEPVPSIALGTTDISPYEMTGAFNTFPSGGKWIAPYSIERITDKYGNVIYEATPRQRVVFDSADNYVMIKMLQYVFQHGTSVRLWLPSYPYKFPRNAPIAAKTGTTNDHADGWFIGFTPQLTAGAWVGGEERTIHFVSMRYGQGASMALPIWARFFKKVFADSTLPYSLDVPFYDISRDRLKVEVDCTRFSETDTLDINLHEDLGGI